MQQFTRRGFLVRSAGTLAAAGVGGVLLGACGDDDDDAGGSSDTTGAGGSAPSASLQTLTMQAAWINDAEFAGYFVAIDNGYYAEEGIDLTYLPGGPDVIPESILLAGQADIALTTPDTTIKAIVDEGAPFRIIGTQYQKNPIGIVSLRASGISTPQDLVGRTLAVPPVNVLTVEAMLTLNGIAIDDVNIVPYSYDPTPLIEGEVDATLDFTTNVPFAIEQAGADPVSFLLFDFGFTTYNDTVVVTEQTLADKRDLLVAWLRASRRGWAENFVDPAAYPPQFADTWFAGTGRTLENELFFNAAQQPIIEHADGIFAMTPADIESNLTALAAVGIEGTPDMFVTDLLAEV